MNCSNREKEGHFSDLKQYPLLSLKPRPSSLRGPEKYEAEAEHYF